MMMFGRRRLVMTSSSESGNNLLLLSNNKPLILRKQLFNPRSLSRVTFFFCVVMCMGLALIHFFRQDRQKIVKLSQTTTNGVVVQVGLDNKKNVQQGNSLLVGGGNSLDTTIQTCPVTFVTPALDRKQKCCKFSRSSLTCLPNLVIIGAQKSGTTVLHSYLLLHPNLLAGLKKEFHIFDLYRNFVAMEKKFKTFIPGLTIPLQYSHVPSRSLPHSLTREQISFDSSPSYIADRYGCSRMAQVLSKDARFVLILRNPVDRVWSDILMKRRRIQSQEEFLSLILPTFHKEIATCLLLTAEVNSSSSMEQFRRCLPKVVSEHGRIVAFYRFVTRQASISRKFIDQCLQSEDSVRSCLKKPEYKDVILKEHMPPIPQVLYDEAEQLQLLLGDCCDEGNHSEDSIENDDGDEAAANNNNSECQGCGCHCFPKATMMSDISKNYLWRSLYYPQLVHCFQSIERSRVLILNTEDLRTDPQSVMTQVFVHAGVPKVNFLPLHTADALFKKRYPDFETISGWSHRGNSHSTDETIPFALKQKLEEFFRPYNKKLFEFLQIPPFHGWNV